MKKTQKNRFFVLKFLDLSNKKDELKKTEGIFTQNVMNDLIRVKLKDIIKLQDII